MRWLNQGAPKRARPRAGERVKQPGGSTATWNKPIVAAAGDTPWDGTAPDDDSPPVPSPPPTTVRHAPATAGDDFWRVTFDDEPSGTVAT